MVVRRRRSRTSVTPEEARRVWDSQREPTPTSVARALTQAGRPVGSKTIARWKAENWPSRPARRHPLDIAEDRLDAALPLLTGDPTSSVRSILNMQQTAEMAERLEEDQRRRLQLRALCTAGIVIGLELARRAHELVPTRPLEVAALLEATMRAFAVSASDLGQGDRE